MPDGVVNDRWIEPPQQRGAIPDGLARVGGVLLQRFWSLIPDGYKSLTFPANHHYDFRTPEYASFDTVQEKKWESTRGVGHSFGANRNERPEDIDGDRTGPVLRRHRRQERQPAHRYRPRRVRPVSG